MNQHFKILLFFLALCNVSFGQSDADLVKEVVKKRTIEGHIYFLASDELRGRATGSPEIDIAAKYLAVNLQKYGVQPVPGAKDYFQQVEMEGIKPATDLRIKLGSNEIKGYSDIIPMTNDNINVEAEVVFVGYGFEDDYKGKDVKGKIVIAKGGSKDKNDGNAMFQMSSAKRTTASALGVRVLIELAPVPSEPWKSMVGFLSREKFGLASGEESTLAHIWLRDSDGKYVNEIKEISRQKGVVEIAGGERNKVFGKNVVGMVEGTDPKLKREFVIYSAHYDHVGIGTANAEGDSIYNGARDNAVGVVTVLSAAESIARNPTKRSALFILFTGEEKGLLGSKWYASHPVLPLNQMVYCFNSDNASYNDTGVATIVGLNRTTAADNIKKACETFGLKALDDPAPEQNLFDRSDNVNFASKGVPAPTFSLGFTAFDAEVFKYYHQVTDNPDSLDYDYLLKFFQSYVLACRLIANDQNTPFWVEGDKYYEVGKKLYK